jgi:hypothetical protein
VSAVNLGDTRNCPQEQLCISCGDSDELDVRTFTAVVGVFCVTLCPRCTGGERRRWSVAQVVRRSLDHCGHLGITVDQMAVTMEREARGDPGE